MSERRTLAFRRQTRVHPQTYCTVLLPITALFFDTSSVSFLWRDALLPEGISAASRSAACHIGGNSPRPAPPPAARAGHRHATAAAAQRLL